MARNKYGTQSQKFPKCVKWRDANPSKDIVIIVVGQTGVGISTFIKCLLDDNDQIIKVREKEDANLESCTRDIQPVLVRNTETSILPGLQLVVLDTPGFNNSVPEIHDLAILDRVQQWLELSYDGSIQGLGVIYLHDISQSRVTSETLILFKGLQGLPRSYGHIAVVLCTTKWPSKGQDPVDAKGREKQLQNKFWKKMISEGAKVGQFEGTKESAWQIMQQILGLAPKQVNVQRSSMKTTKTNCAIC